MIISPQEKGFYILPLLKISKYSNPLSEQAKISFESDWNYYIIISFGWLFWTFELCITNK